MQIRIDFARTFSSTTKISAHLFNSGPLLAYALFNSSSADSGVSFKAKSPSIARSEAKEDAPIALVALVEISETAFPVLMVEFPVKSLVPFETDVVSSAVPRVLFLVAIVLGKKTSLDTWVDVSEVALEASVVGILVAFVTRVEISDVDFEESTLLFTIVLKLGIVLFWVTFVDTSEEDFEVSVVKVDVALVLGKVTSCEKRVTLVVVDLVASVVGTVIFCVTSVEAFVAFEDRFDV